MARVLPIPDRVSSDVETIRAHARVVLEITSGGVIVRENESWRLNVIAVVGHGVCRAKGRWRRAPFPEALLLEVGVSRGTPYTETTGYGGARNGHKLSRRHQWFALSKAQYRACAPALFDAMRRIAMQEIAQWEFGFGRPFFIRTPRYFYHMRRHHLLWRYANRIEKQPSIRFRIAHKDRLLVRDMFALHFANPRTIATHRERSKFLKIALDNAPSYWKGSWPFAKTRAAEAARALLGDLEEHDCVAVLMGVSRSPLQGTVAKLFEWDTLTPSRGHRLAAAALPDIENRCTDVAVVIVNGNGNNKKNHQHGHGCVTVALAPLNVS